MERMLVANGVAAPLLHAVQADVWPPSLRAVAAGYLQSLHEWHPNHLHTGGMPVFIAALINLLDTKVSGLVL